MELVLSGRKVVADTFVEVIAAPWFARLTVGTAALTRWLRSLGATIGRGVWCDTAWLPEPDLIHLHDGATVNRGCVVQTHLFHDRLSCDWGRSPCMLAQHWAQIAVILPATTLGWMPPLTGLAGHARGIRAGQDPMDR